MFNLYLLVWVLHGKQSLSPPDYMQILYLRSHPWEQELGFRRKWGGRERHSGVLPSIHANGAQSQDP